MQPPQSHPALQSDPGLLWGGSSESRQCSELPLPPQAHTTRSSQRCLAFVDDVRCSNPSLPMARHCLTRILPSCCALGPPAHGGTPPPPPLALNQGQRFAVAVGFKQEPKAMPSCRMPAELGHPQGTAGHRGRTRGPPSPPTAGPALRIPRWALQSMDWGWRMEQVLHAAVSPQLLQLRSCSASQQWLWDPHPKG
mgnify:CR=1 FL=1